MNPQFRLKNHVLLVALAAAYPLAGHAAGAARLEFVSGNVVAVTAAGVQRELSRGSELNAGDTIRTGDNARAQLRFSDGGMMSLQPKTDFRIDEYKYEGKIDGEERSFFSLIRGGLRTISGLIGHGNRDNYRVTTSVATIGIRGTEYSAVFTGGKDGELDLATGEGAVQICNAGGCVIVASGQSAVVTGNSPPQFTPVRPYLPPTPVSGSSIAAPFAASEARSTDGSLAGIETKISPADLSLKTGTYAIAAAFYTGYYGDYSSAASTTVTFEAGSKLVNYSDGYSDFTAGTVKGAFSLDGIIGWGSWSSGTYYNEGSSPLQDLHYVVGKGTNDLSNLTGMTATYQLVGFTNPTSSLGYVGSNVTGSLTADFSGGGTSVTADIGFAMQGTSVTAALSMSGSGATFSGGGSCTGCGSSGSVYAQGLFAGKNASHAGLVYQIDATSGGLGTITGSQVYKQTGVAPSPLPM